MVDDGNTEISIVSCGHSFCTPCIEKWHRISAECPLCKMVSRPQDVVRVGGRTKDAENSVRVGGRTKGDENSFRFRPFDTQNALESHSHTDSVHDSTPILRSYGVKIDAILKHVKYIHMKEPGVKMLIFSQWQSVLDILKYGLRENGIKSVELSGADKKRAKRIFVENDDVSVFILHSRSQSAGLTLVEATHCFIVEPLLNQSVELQAINRIHRIGQTRQTFVHRYIIAGSIEEKIMSVRGVEGASQDAPSASFGREGELLKWEDMARLVDFA